MHRVLTMETEDGNNAWYAAQDSANDIGNFVSDIALARDRAERESLESSNARQLQILYTLMLASVNSIAVGLSVELVIELVETGVWTVRRGLDIVRRLPNEIVRVRALCAIASRAPDHLANAIWLEALKTVREISEERRRAVALGSLGELLPDTLRAQALEISKTVANPYDRSKGLLDFALAAPTAEAKRMMLLAETEVLGSITSPPRRSEILRRTVVVRGQIGQFAAVWGELAEEERREVVADVVECFDASLILEAVAAAETIVDPRMREFVLARLVVRIEHLAGEATAKRLLESLRDPETTDLVLSETAVERAKKGNCDAALALAGRISRLSLKSVTLARIAATAPLDRSREISHAARQLQDSVYNLRYQGECQAALAKCAAIQGDLDGALATIRQIELPLLRARALNAVVQHLDDPCPPLLELAKSVPFSALAEGVRALTPERRREVLERIVEQERIIGDEAEIILALARSGGLEPQECVEALRRTAKIADLELRSLVMVELAKTAPPQECLHLIHRLAAEIHDATYAGKVQAVTLPRLVETGYDQIRAIAEAFAIADPEGATRALIGCAAMMPLESASLIYERVGVLARLIADPSHQMDIIAEIARKDAQFANPIWEHAIRMVEHFIERYKSGADAEGASRVLDIVRKVAPHLPDSYLKQLRQVVIGITDRDYRDAPLLAILRRFVSLGDRASARKLVHHIQSPSNAVQAGLEILRLAPADKRKREIALLTKRALRIEDAAARARIFTQLASQAQSDAHKADAFRLAVEALENVGTSGVMAEETERVEEVELSLDIAAQWASMDAAGANRLWTSALRKLSAKSRTTVLELLPKIVETLDHNHEGHFRGGVNAVLSVSRWWP